MFCPECGKEIHPQAEFCPECGKKIDINPETPRETSAELSPPAKKYSKFLIFFLSFIFLAILAGAGFYYWQTNLQSPSPSVTSQPTAPQVSPTPQPTPTPPLASQDKINIISASSTLVIPNYDYSPEKINDKDTKTAWCEGKEDTGEGEWILLVFNQPIKIETLRIFSGFGKTEELFMENNRPRKIEIEFSNKRRTTLEIPEKFEITSFDLPPEVKEEPTIYLKLTLKKVSKGTKYNDTCISEVDF